MATVSFDAIVTAFEARLNVQISNVQIMDRLDDPRENPRHRAHLGVRAWPDATEDLEMYCQNDLQRMTTTVEVESLYQMRRSGSASLTTALQFEDSIRIALTNSAWWRSTLDDGAEVRYMGSEREEEEGWVFITSTFEVDHDVELGG